MNPPRILTKEIVRNYEPFISGIPESASSHIFIGYGLSEYQFVEDGAFDLLLNDSGYLCHLHLVLDGLITISDRTAWELNDLYKRNYGCIISLRGLVHLSEYIYDRLVELNTELRNELLRSIGPPPELDHESYLLIREVGTVYADEITKLSDSAAEDFSQHKGWLGLPNVKYLSDSAAESLSRHQGDLCLDGLIHLSDAAAANLRKHVGNLFLSGLEFCISDEAAISLSKHLGPVYLNQDNDLILKKYLVTETPISEA